MNRFKLLFLSCTALALAGCASVISDGPGGPNPFAITVSPASASIPGNTTQQFTAKTSDGSGPTLAWSVNGVVGGSATTGTISATGLFSAPEFPPTPNGISVSATETQDSAKSGSSAVTLLNPVPQLNTASPMAIPVGAFTLAISGAQFAPGATVNFGSAVLTTTYVSSTQLTATGTATSAQIGNISITVGNPTPGSALSGSIIALVKGSAVTVLPGTANVRTGATQLFTATVTGMSNTGVSWSVNGVPGGNATVGTIIGNGNYSAPVGLPSPNNITVTATSIADSTQSGNSAITIVNPAPVLTSIAPPSVSTGSFTLTLTGSGFVNGAVVNFGTTALTTTFVSSTQLTAMGTALASQAGNVPVTVTNPNPGSATSAAVQELVTVPNANIKVTVSPLTATLVTDGTQLFTATVVGTTNTAVTWSVNGLTGGDSDTGTIDKLGNYNAPDNLPSPNSVTVTATSVADPTKSGNATVTFLNPVPVLTSITPGTIGLGAFQISLNGTGFVNTSTISVTLVGAPPTLNYASPMLMSAVGSIAAANDFTVTVTNPPPGGGTSGAVTVHVTTAGTPVSSAAAVRFLEQASFGPDSETVAQMQETGFDQYLQNQFNAANTAFKDPTTTTQIYDLQRIWFVHAVAGGDQLRQRTSLALNELWVVGADKVSDPLGYTNYLRTLNQDALGNYLDIMKDVTLSPAMGDYLDMVNNDKPAPGQHANENYAREIMQLFTVGLNQLNPDGSSILDATGNPVPSYTQNDVMALGLAFTGWTYPTQAGMTAQKHNPTYYGGPMIAVESNHDMTAKTLLGQSIPPGQTAEADLDSALGIIFNHPNVGPFVARQLILRLVTSNPSPTYMQNVAAAFNTGTFTSGGISYGKGVRGDMQAVLAATLLDPEARRGDSSITAVATDGKLREPIVMEVGIARAFHAITDAAGFSNEGNNMEQNVFYPPTVFNFFPPTSPIQGSTLNGPEFAIFDTTSSLERVNFINDATYGAIGSFTHLDFTPVINSGPGSTPGTPDQMLAWLYTLFLHSSSQDSMYSTVLNAVNAVDTTNTKAQAQAAIYLVTSSSMYQVQH